MKTIIDNVIEELVSIGQKYPKELTYQFIFFKKHSNQLQAQYLKNLATINRYQYSDEEKIAIVQYVIKKIYSDLSKEGSLINQIHSCIIKPKYGSISQQYREKMAIIIKEIEKENANIKEYEQMGASEGRSCREISCDMPFYMSEYKAMANAIIPQKKENLHPELFTRELFINMGTVLAQNNHIEMSPF